MFSQFRNKFPLTDQEWLEFTGYFRQIEVPAKTVLLREGDVSKKVYLIEKGCVRVWFNNNGKDVTYQFFFENGVVASIESFRKGIKSPVTIETLEPCIIWWIDKTDVDKILERIKSIPELQDMFINGIFERTYDYMRHFFASIKDSPEQRYLDLINERKEIVRRIPQHYIASYLGISTVHLSRIKSKLLRERNNSAF